MCYCNPEATDAFVLAVYNHWNGGLEWWTGMVDWNGGMDYSYF